LGFDLKGLYFYFSYLIVKTKKKQAWKLSSSKPEPSFSKEGVNVVSTKSQTILNFFSINKFDGQIFTLGNKLWNSLTFSSKLTEFTVRDHLPKCKQLQV